MNRGMDDGMITGLVLGAGLMYLLDPDKGKRRRAMLQEQVGHLARQLEDGLDTGARDMRNRASGMLAETRGRLRHDDAPDPVVEARVRSALGRLVSHPGAITVAVENGTATLRGEILADEVNALRSGVAAVRGVKEVVDGLTVHEHPGDVPGLQGGRRREPPRVDVLQENWAPATRLLMGVVGGTLALRGMRDGGPLGSVLTLAGLGLASRAVTNLDFGRLTGLDAGRRAVDLHKIITIAAPVEEVFAFWSNFENFPRFMSHLMEVRRIDAQRSHWVAQGPAGLEFAWDAETTGFEPNRVIAWKSVGRSPIRNAGIVRFQDVGGGSTRLDIRLSYNPPAGALGHAVASFFRANPRQLMDEDLVRLKSLLEEGKTTAHGHSVAREEIPVGETVGTAGGR